MKSLKALILFLLFSNLFLTTMNAQTGNFSAAYKKFKAVYEQELKQAGIVGSSFAFLKDNKILAEDFYGMANLEKIKRLMKTQFITGHRIRNLLRELPLCSSATEVC